MPTLKVISGPAAGQTLEIEDEIVVGREGADLTIADSEMSRRHAALRPVDGGVEVEDLGSLNGTFVGDRRIDAPETLSSSTAVRMGLSAIRVEIEPPAVAQPDVTAPRAIPQPDVTAPRAIPDPDVTAPRAIPQPDVTAKRDVPAPPADAPAADAAPAPAERRGTPTGLVAALAIALVVLLVVLVLLLA